VRLGELLDGPGTRRCRDGSVICAGPQLSTDKPPQGRFSGLRHGFSE
jgi:hypothetical protein